MEIRFKNIEKTKSVTEFVQEKMDKLCRKYNENPDIHGEISMHHKKYTFKLRVDPIGKDKFFNAVVTAPSYQEAIDQACRKISRQFQKSK